MRRFEKKQNRFFPRSLATHQEEDTREDDFLSTKSLMDYIVDLQSILKESPSREFQIQLESARNDLKLRMKKLTDAGFALPQLYSKFGGNMLRAQLINANETIAKANKESEYRIVDLMDEDTVQQRLNPEAYNRNQESLQKLRDVGFNVTKLDATLRDKLQRMIDSDEDLDTILSRRLEYDAEVGQQQDGVKAMQREEQKVARAMGQVQRFAGAAQRVIEEEKKREDENVARQQQAEAEQQQLAAYEAAEIAQLAEIDLEMQPIQKQELTEQQRLKLREDAAGLEREKNRVADALYKKNLAKRAFQDIKKGGDPLLGRVAKSEKLADQIKDILRDQMAPGQEEEEKKEAFQPESMSELNEQELAEVSTQLETVASGESTLTEALKQVKTPNQKKQMITTVFKTLELPSLKTTKKGQVSFKAADVKLNRALLLNAKLLPQSGENRSRIEELLANYK